MRRLAATLLAGTLAASAASAADTIGTLSGRRQQYAPQDPIQVEAIFEELTSLPPSEHQPAFSMVELVLLDAVQRGTRHPSPHPGPDGVRLICRSRAFPELEALRAGQDVILYTQPSFPSTWLGVSSVWFLAADLDCEDLRSGDIPMTCRIEELCDRCSGECPAMGIAFPGKPRQPSILCGDRATVRTAVSAANPTTTRRATPVPRPGTEERAARVAFQYTGGHNVIGLPVGPRDREVVKADFNEDGEFDRAIAFMYYPTVRIMLGRGGRIFDHAHDIYVGEFPSAIDTGDFDGDGHYDLVVALTTDHAVLVLRGDGEGMFEQISTINLPRGICELIVGGFEGDPSLDVIVRHCAAGNLPPTWTTLVGDGNGNLASAAAAK
jgi:hypothetical protein